MKNIKRLALKLFVIALIVILINLTILWYTGKIWLNNPSRMDYPVRGVDVSVYQGEIDWNKLMDQSLDFAFIKATEGTIFVDEAYISNRQSVEKLKNNYAFGFYHFFSFQSSGYDQADNFINTVGELNGYLPPVVDIELYGKLKWEKPNKDNVITNLSMLLEKLEMHYGVKPIIYTTSITYKTYIEENFDDYPLWIRNVFSKPKNNNWTFWQFTDKGKLFGYNGEEKFIDLNVFNGSINELHNLKIKTPEN